VSLPHVIVQIECSYL